jgi:1,4-dihydroxy-2-naphthoate polyprenyltransferase
MHATTRPPVRPLAVWFAATRPRFLTITGVAVMVGIAGAAHDGTSTDWVRALLVLLGALLAHAGANVINDFHDRDADLVNLDRLFPFTGGSRTIQDGLLGAAAMARFGYALLAATALVGLTLASDGRPQLWAVGALGLALAVAYSAPPLRLSGRGFGEFVIAAAWLLVVVGTDVVQRGAWSATPLAAGLPIALLVAAILHVNQFPDRHADGAAHKRTSVVLLGARASAAVHVALVSAAYAWLAFAVAAGLLPALALAGLLAAPVSVVAATGVLRNAGREPTTLLLPAVKATILAAHLHGLLLAAALSLG